MTVAGRAGVIDQLELYRLYQKVPTPEEYRRVCELEGRWIGGMADQLEAEAPDLPAIEDFEVELAAHLRTQAETPSQDHDYLARHATVEEFKVVAAEFAPDGLTESLSLMSVLARAPFQVAMPIVRILIDELGCGNENRAHAHLYAGLLEELGMSQRPDDYVERVTPESLAYVNMFHWLAGRCSRLEYFLGGYAFFENSVLYGFRSYAACARRHRLDGAHYFTEHLYIDRYHAREMRRATRELARTQPVETTKL